MKKAHHIKVARGIAADSWALLRFESLPLAATVEQQVEALRGDQAWIRDHCEDVVREIDDLIDMIQRRRSLKT